MEVAMTKKEMIDNMQYLGDRVLHGEILLMKWMSLIDGPMEGMPIDKLKLMEETHLFITRERGNDD